MRVLLVEDDNLLGDGILTGLRQCGYATDWVRDGEAAEVALTTESYDLAVLDLGLPRRSGIEVLKNIRAKGKTLPVIILTARDTTVDKVSGLDYGADDYMIKPFDLDELSARIRALARRQHGRVDPLIHHTDIELDPASHSLKRCGVPIDLAPREFAILHTLLENTGRVIARSTLAEKIYSRKDEVDSNAIEVHIHHLRKKLGADIIRTIRGVGYIVDKA